MRWSRIKALLLQQFFIVRRGVEIWADLLVFTTVNVVVFGLISRYLSGTGGEAQADFVVLGMLLWEVVRVAQYCITVNSLWAVWSHNLSNIWIAPISTAEYVTAYAMSAAAVTFAIFAMLSAVASVAFGFDVLDVGLATLAVGFANLVAFAVALGLVLLGFVFRFGTRIAAISWGAIFLLQPLSAAFFPVGVLPPPFEALAWSFPATYVFEASRAGLATGAARWDLLLGAAALNVAYLVGSLAAFRWLFLRARIVGQFARNDA